jgi:hypothetical protein
MPTESNPMKRSPKAIHGQFTLALHPEPDPHLDAKRKEELLMALADLLLEAVGMELAQSKTEKEGSDESEDHA